MLGEFPTELAWEITARAVLGRGGGGDIVGSLRIVGGFEVHLFAVGGDFALGFYVRVVSPVIRVLRGPWRDLPLLACARSSSKVLSDRMISIAWQVRWWRRAPEAGSGDRPDTGCDLS